MTVQCFCHWSSEVFFQQLWNAVERLLEISPERGKHWRVGRVASYWVSVSMKRSASGGAVRVVHRVLWALERAGLWFSWSAKLMLRSVLTDYEPIHLFQWLAFGTGRYHFLNCPGLGPYFSLDILCSLTTLQCYYSPRTNSFTALYFSVHC